MSDMRSDGTGPADSYVGGPVRFLSKDYPGGRFTLVTSPIPAARVDVFYNAKNGLWYYQVTSERLTAAFPIKAPKGMSSADSYREAALAKGAQAASAYALVKWKQDFTGAQRYAIGHGRCGHVSGCDQTPDVGSIWCAWHPFGRTKGK